MAIYRMPRDKQRLVELSDTSFAEEGIREVEDLQRILQDQPEVIEKDLFIIRSEFSDWQGSGRSIDLLALDADGRLVVIELKRTRTGDHAELQAIRYAAMVANLTFDRIVKAHQDYLYQRGIQEDAEARICDHLGISDSEAAEVSTETPRIILVSEGFSNELTTSVLWLNDNFGLDIKCIRLRPYRNGEDFLVESGQMIPLPEAAAYRTQFREREKEIQKQRSSPSTSVPGSDAFRESTKGATEKSQPELKRLYDWAKVLEREDLAILETTFAKTQTSLGVIAPGDRGTGRILQIIHGHDNHGRDYQLIWLFNSIMDRLAPQTAVVVKELMATEHPGKKAQIASPSEKMLNLLTDAYREANGQ